MENRRIVVSSVLAATLVPLTLVLWSCEGYDTGPVGPADGPAVPEVALAYPADWEQEHVEPGFIDPTGGSAIDLASPPDAPFYGEVWGVGSGDQLGGESLWAPPAGTGRVLFVDDDGGAVAAGTSVSVFTTIQAAIDAANPGDTIEVQAGQYVENLVIAKPLILTSSQAATITSAIADSPVVSISSGGVTVEGLGIAGARSSRAGIYVEKGAQGAPVLLRGNVIFDNFHGVSIENYQVDLTVTVIGNTIRDNTGTGMASKVGGALLVTENEFLRNGNAIYVYSWSAGKSRVYHNNFIGNTEAQTSPSTGVVWHDGYPSSGNHWSSWTSPDVSSGPNQDIPGADGVVDVAYGEDRYPVVAPNGWMPRNIPPVANAGPDLIDFPLAPYPGASFLLDATGSSDSDGTIVEYAWLFDDGTVRIDSPGGSTDGTFDGRTTYAYADAGVSHVVTLRVTDNLGATATDTAVVRVLDPSSGITEIGELIGSYDLPPGSESALLAKLRTAAAALAAGDIAAARQALEDLLGQLGAAGFCANKTPPGFCEAISAEVQRLLNAL